MIAQDLQPVLPEAIESVSINGNLDETGPMTPTEILTTDPNVLLMVAINALKEIFAKGNY